MVACINVTQFVQANVAGITEPLLIQQGTKDATCRCEGDSHHMVWVGCGWACKKINNRATAYSAGYKGCDLQV